MLMTSPITEISGVGEKTAAMYHKMNIFTIHDLISHYPRDYEEWKDICNISEMAVNQTNLICATVLQMPQTLHVRKNMAITTIHVKDETGSCDLVYFNMPYVKNTFQPGKRYLLRGKTVLRKNVMTMEHPKIVTEDELRRSVNRMTPIYATTKGLTSQAISKSIRYALDNLVLTDYLSAAYKEAYQLCTYTEALRGIHFPENKEMLIRARKRLVFDEFLLFIISVMSLKDMTKQQMNDTPMMKIDACQDFIDRLPYQLTNAQKKVWKEIETDLCSTHFMNRLVQGDVGSGKTIVAILAILMCVMNHKQAAFMAPTEVLAKQHYETILSYAEEYQLPFQPVLLTGSLTAKEKREAKAQIETGECNVIIGTQALIQDTVNFYDLHLVITDEQHRFGVKQREALAQKGVEPHVLVMSATPIPRTLALILYGDLAISVMDELPANRLPIKNCVVNTDYRKKAYEFIHKEVCSGRQAYIICPMVEPNEDGEEQQDLENVVEYTEKMKQILPDIRIAALHGQMKPKEKNEIMEAYAAHEIDVLVSTTVIEVGINVPNATVMMVENAERFGLAQLHQLRGRVGRGKHQSYCIFMSANGKKETMQRLEVLNKSNDGFFISSEDMRMRGPGDLFGIRQSGQFQFRLGDIYQDATILQTAQECATDIFEDFENRSRLDLIPFWDFYDENIFSTVDFINI